MRQYRIKEYEELIVHWDSENCVDVYEKKKRYMPEVKTTYLFGLISFWENLSEYAFSTEYKAEVIINNCKLRDEISKNRNVKYINK